MSMRGMTATRAKSDRSRICLISASPRLGSIANHAEMKASTSAG